MKWRTVKFQMEKTKVRNWGKYWWYRWYRFLTFRPIRRLKLQYSDELHSELQCIHGMGAEKQLLRIAEIELINEIINEVKKDPRVTHLSEDFISKEVYRALMNGDIKRP